MATPGLGEVPVFGKEKEGCHGAEREGTLPVGTGRAWPRGRATASGFSLGIFSKLF